jgi:TetR/AcrR family transcriptional regulator, ethionamide resistance regulator
VADRVQRQRRTGAGRGRPGAVAFRRLKRAPPGKRRTSVQPAATLKARGLRSRDLIKNAARDALNEKGFTRLRVQDVTERAGVANGLFYRYFSDLREVVAEVSSTFFDELLAETSSLSDRSDPYRWIYDNHCIVVESFARNPGILACLFGLAGDYAEFDEIWKRNAHTWNLQVARFLQETAGFPPTTAERMGFVLGAMTEGVIYQELIRHTEDLAQLARRPEDIAEVIAVMWYRAIYLENPPTQHLRSSGRRLIHAGGAR